jgi:hypothetical protein
LWTQGRGPVPAGRGGRHLGLSTRGVPSATRAAPMKRSPCVDGAQRGCAEPCAQRPSATRGRPRPQAAHRCLLDAVRTRQRATSLMFDHAPAKPGDVPSAARSTAFAAKRNIRWCQEEHLPWPLGTSLSANEDIPWGNDVVRSRLASRSRALKKHLLPPKDAPRTLGGAPLNPKRRSSVAQPCAPWPQGLSVSVSEIISWGPRDDPLSLEDSSLNPKR